MAIPPVLWRTFSASLIHASPSSHGEGQLPSPDSLPLAMCLLFVFHFLVSTNCRHLCHHYFTLKLLNSLPNWAPFSQALSCSSQTTHWYHIHSPKIWVWYSFVDILHILQSQAQAQLLSVLWSFPWPSQPVDTFSFEPPSLLWEEYSSCYVLWLLLLFPLLNCELPVVKVFVSLFFISLVSLTWYWIHRQYHWNFAELN